MRIIYLTGSDPYILGKKGDDNATTIRVNVEDWYTAYSSGTGVIIYTGTNQQSYPLECSVTTVDGVHYLQAILTEQETASAGWVVISASWYNGDTMVYSRTFSGKILSNPANQSCPQERMPDWVRELLEGLGDAKDAISEASGIIATAESAAGYAEDAEAFGAGTRGGDAVPSGDDAYHNNAAYYSNLAQTYAANAMSATPEGYSSIVADLAPLYSTASTYAVGDYVMYNSKIYRCTTAVTTAGSSFSTNSSKFTEVKITDELTLKEGYIESSYDIAMALVRSSSVKIDNTAVAYDDSHYIDKTDGSIGVNTAYRRSKSIALPTGAKYVVITSCAGSNVAFSLAFYTTKTPTAATYVADSGVATASDITSPKAIVVAIPDTAKYLVACTKDTVTFEAWIVQEPAESATSALLTALMGSAAKGVTDTDLTEASTTISSAGALTLEYGYKCTGKKSLPEGAQSVIVTSSGVSSGLTVAFYDSSDAYIADSGYSTDATIDPPYLGEVNVPSTAVSYAMACKTDHTFEAWIITKIQAEVESLDVIKTEGSVFANSPYWRKVNFGVPVDAHYTPSDSVSGDITAQYTGGYKKVNGVNTAVTFNGDTKSTDVYACVDALVTDYPNFISRSSTVGTASDGVTNIYTYHIQAPKPVYESTTQYTITDAEIAARVPKVPKIIITSGVHGYEKGAVYEVYYFLRDMFKNWKTQPILDYFLHHTEIYWIPLVNPFGFDTDYTMQTSAEYDPSTKGIYLNYNKVNINRNFNDDAYAASAVDPDDYDYGEQPIQNYSGTEADSEAETQYVEALFNNNTDTWLHVDAHTLGSKHVDFTKFNTVRIDPSVTDDYFKQLDRAALRSVQTCNDHFKGRLTLADMVTTDEDPDGSVLYAYFNTFVTGRVDCGKRGGNMKSWAAEVPKILSVTLETGNGISSVFGSQQYVEKASIACTEALGNFLNSCCVIYSKLG